MHIGFRGRHVVDEAQALERFREKMERELRSGLVTLSLLLAIARTGPEYGYRILRTVQETSGGRLAFKEGTAYPLLQNLERMGLVTSFWSDGSTGPPRKYYQTTRLGERALAQTLEDWGTLTASVDRLVTHLGSPDVEATRPAERMGGRR